jgi:hypothetical protein
MVPLDGILPPRLHVMFLLVKSGTGLLGVSTDVHTFEDRKSIPIVLYATAISRRLGRDIVVLTNLPRKVRHAIDFDALEISMRGH